MTVAQEQKVTALLMQTGLTRNNEYISEAALTEYWNKLPAIPAGAGLPLVRSDGSNIGRITNFTFSGRSTIDHQVEGGSGKVVGIVSSLVGMIVVEAVITDTMILNNPGLNLDQVVRAAIWFMLEGQG